MWDASAPTPREAPEPLAGGETTRGEMRSERPRAPVARQRRRLLVRARRGEGPTFVECLTYRIGPHSSSDDPTRYRSNDEVAAWAKRDPIVRFERYLRRAEILDDAKQASLEAELESEFEAAIAAIETLPPPSRESLFEDIYAPSAPLPWHLKEQQAQLLALPTAPSGH